MIAAVEGSRNPRPPSLMGRKAISRACGGRGSSVCVIEPIKWCMVEWMFVQNSEDQ